MLRERGGALFDGGGLAVTALLSALVIWWHPNARLPEAPPPQAQPVQLSVVETPPTPPAPPAPPPPAPAPQEAAPPPPVQTVQPNPLPTPPQHHITHPRLRRPPTPPAPPQAASPAQPAPPAAFTLPPTQAPARDARAEDSYIAGLHAYLLGRTAPPDTAAYKLTRPYGTTDVGFTLTRSGAVLNVRVLRSSGSALLDRQALAIVQGGRYPAIPAQAFAGEAAHVFHIPIEFRPTGNGQ